MKEASEGEKRRKEKEDRASHDEIQYQFLGSHWASGVRKIGSKDKRGSPVDFWWVFVWGLNGHLCLGMR